MCHTQTGEEGEYNTHSVFPQNWRESWREGNGERGYYWCATVAYILHPLSALSLMCESVKVEEEEEEEEGCHSRTMRHFSSLFPFAPFLSISSPIAVSPSFPPLVQHQSNVRSCLSGGGGQGRRKDNRASAAVQTVNIGTFSILLLFCYIRSGEASLNGGRFCCSFCFWRSTIL